MQFCFSKCQPIEKSEKAGGSRMLKQILVIDSDAKNRRLLIDTLSSAYELHITETGEQALDILSAKKASRISAIILNISSSEAKGLSFLATLHGAPGLNDLPVLVLANSYDSAVETKGLELGAYDFVPMPFNPAILLFRLKNTIERSEYAAFGKYRYLAEYDAISGVYNRVKFYDITHRMLSAHPETHYALARFDLDRFKAYNDLFGMAAGDKLLLEIGRHFRRYFSSETTFGRLEADHFVFCLPVEKFDPSRCLLDFVDHFTKFQPNFVLSPRIGVYLIDDPSLEVSLMCDRALMALRSVKDGSSQRIAYYNDSMRKLILEEQALIGDVETALMNEQFEVYLQPQYNHRTRQLVGAEALVRWNHPERGMISPGSFIPILEKNGFISRLDYFVWERVCRLLAYWHASGMPGVSISVNISRADIHMHDFCQKLISLTRKYNIKPHELRLEITETAYIENAEQLLQVIDKLRDEGFLIEMDDFGKGYSSLNTLKNVPVDVLKLDLGFLHESESSGDRGGIILNSVMHMAHWLNLAVVAEGVETLRQADYLTSIGCDTVQGYLYSRPLPIPEFEALLARGDVGAFIGEYALLSQIDVKELWDPDAEATTIFKSFVGAAGLFELHNEILSTQRVNQKLCNLMEIDFSSYNDYSSNALDIFTNDQRASIVSMLHGAIDSGNEATCQILYFTNACKQGKRLYFRAQQIAGSVDRHVFFVVCEDITIQQKEIETQRWQNEQNRILIENTTATAFDYDPDADTLVSYHTSFGEGMQKTVLDHFLSALPDNTAIHPASMEDYSRLFRAALARPCTLSDEFLVNINNSGYRWHRITLTSVQDDIGRIYRIVGRADDIQLERDRARACSELETTLRKKAETDAVTGLLAKGTVNMLIRNQISRLAKDELGYLMLLDLDDFKRVNEMLGNSFGDTLLEQVGRHLEKNFQPCDLLGRVGGNTFIAYTQNLQDEPSARLKAEEILRSLEDIPVPQLGQIRGSIGITTVAPGRENFHVVLEHADCALYYAKNLGKKRYVLYSDLDSSLRTNHYVPRVSQAPSAEISALQNVLIEQVFHLLFCSSNLEVTIGSCLAVIGNLADVSRISVFEACDRQTIVDTFEWCSGETNPQKRLFRYAPAGSVAARDFRALHGRDGLFFFSSPDDLPAELQDEVRRAGIQSLVQYSLPDDGQTLGYISFEELRPDRTLTEEKIELHQRFARIISVFLLKKRSADRVAVAKSYLDAVFHCVDKPTFVLDSKTKNVSVCNLCLRELLGRDVAGSLCYQAIYGFDAPCAKCPVFSQSEPDDSKSQSPSHPAETGPCKLAFHSKFDGKWLLVPDIAKNSTK